MGGGGGGRMGMGALVGADAGGETGTAQRRGTVAARLLSELRPYRGTLAFTLALVVVAAAAQALGPWLVGRAVDGSIHRGDARGLARTMLLLCGVYVVGAFAQRAQSRRMGIVGQQLLATLRDRLFARLLRLPLGYFAAHRTGDLVSRVSNDVDTLNQLIGGGLTQVLGLLLGLVGMAAAMLALDVRLALASFVVIPVMLGVTAWFARRARTAYRLTRVTVGDVTAGLEEEIAGVREAQAFARTETNVERFRGRNAANRDANVRAVAVTAGFAPSVDVLSTIATTVVIAYGGWRALRGEVTVGVVATFLIYVQQFFRPVQLAAAVYTQAQSALAGAERIYAVLDEPEEPADALDAVALPAGAARIDFDDVSFAYEPGRDVLHGVTFTAAPGQTVALVGPTGAGKTTIANLIPRFYDATAGTVAVDGIDVRAVTRRSLRAGIAIVLQEPFLFGGTIAANIGYGRAGATPAEVEAAARAVHAHAFVAALPDGYDTPLGASGSTLSAGQRQLIVLARAVLADPRILILDEATSHVDTRTEAAIQAALAVVLAGRTSLVIAHRLSTITAADLILVVDGGRVREQGTHAELLAAGGLYARLYGRQFVDTPEFAGVAGAHVPPPTQRMYA